MADYSRLLDDFRKGWADSTSYFNLREGKIEPMSGGEVDTKSSREFTRLAIEAGGTLEEWAAIIGPCDQTEVPGLVINPWLASITYIEIELKETGRE